MSEIEIKHLKSYSELINTLPEDERNKGVWKRAVDIYNKTHYLFILPHLGHFGFLFNGVPQ